MIEIDEMEIDEIAEKSTQEEILKAAERYIQLASVTHTDLRDKMDLMYGAYCYAEKLNSSNLARDLVGAEVVCENLWRETWEDKKELEYYEMDFFPEDEAEMEIIKRVFPEDKLDIIFDHQISNFNKKWLRVLYDEELEKEIREFYKERDKERGKLLDEYLGYKKEENTKKINWIKPPFDD